MKLTINGSPLEVNAPCTVHDLLEKLEMTQGRVAIEVNQSIVPRSLHHSTELSDGDVIEIVHAIGGG